MATRSNLRGPSISHASQGTLNWNSNLPKNMICVFTLRKLCWWLFTRSSFKCASVICPIKTTQWEITRRSWDHVCSGPGGLIHQRATNKRSPKGGSWNIGAMGIPMDLQPPWESGPNTLRHSTDQTWQLKQFGPIPPGSSYDVCQNGGFQGVASNHFDFCATLIRLPSGNIT